MGAFRTAMRADDECVLLWACPDWATWAGFEQAWHGAASSTAGARRWSTRRHRERTVMVDARWRRCARAPAGEADRRPLDEI